MSGDYNGWSTEATWAIHTAVHNNASLLGSWQTKALEFKDATAEEEVTVRLLADYIQRVMFANIPEGVLAGGWGWYGVLVAGLNTVNYQELASWVLETVADKK